MNSQEFNPDPFGPSDEFDPTPQHERPIRDLPDEPVADECPPTEADDEYDDEDYEGQECPVCGYDLDRGGECTGNGCGADLSS